MTAILEPAADEAPPVASRRFGVYLVLFLVPPLALVLGLFSLFTSKASEIGQLGLVSALHPSYFAVVAGLLMSFLLSLRVKTHRSLLLSAHVAVLVFLLHGAPGIIESEPRFATAYLHAGFTGFVAQNGRVLPLIDARFSWPSFFTGSALVDRAAAVDTALHLIRWWPVAMNLGYAALMWQIARWLLNDVNMAWLAAGILPIANWVGQDYYSPQSIGFLLYLAFIFLLVGPLGGEGPPLWKWRPGSGWPAPVPLSEENWGPAWFYQAAALVLMVAMATGHQLTPIFACGSAVVLSAVGRTRPRALVVAFGFLALGWVCYGAVAFWSGHKSELFGNVGSASANLNRALAKRLHGATAHETVVHARLVISAVVWLLAFLGAFLWRGTSGSRRAAFWMTLWPLGLIVGQSYGGEALLRVFLFSLPAAVCCIASLLEGTRHKLRAGVLEALLLAALLPLFLVARWGNELFEITRPAELAGVEQLYRIAPHGSVLVSISPQISWEFTNVNTYQYEPQNIDEFALRSIPAIVRLFTHAPLPRVRNAHHPAGYVIITTGQIDYGWQEYGLPENWGTQVVNLLEHSTTFKLVYQNSATHIFRYLPLRTSG